MTVAHGAMSQSMPIVIAYDTLGEEGLRAALESTRPRAIFLEPQLAKMLLESLPNAESIEFLIFNDANQNISEVDLETIKCTCQYLRTLSFEDLRQLGEENPIKPTPLSPNDLCCITYTSGSSGTPEGVPLTHRNVVATGTQPLPFASDAG